VVVQCVDLPKIRAHLAHLRQKPAGQGRQREVTLFEADAFFAKREEEVRPRVRIDDRLKRRFGFMHLERRGWIDGVTTCVAQEIANHRHIRVEDLCRGGSGAINRELTAWSTRTCGARRYFHRSRRRRTGCLSRRSWRRLSLQCGELPLKRRQSIVELTPQLIDLLLNLLRLIGGLSGCLTRRRDKNGCHSRRAHHLHRSHIHSCGSERDPRREP
jgi:hypothetical protein